MRSQITIKYLIDRTVLTDTLEGSEISFQYTDGIVLVKFPNRDGKFVNSGISSLVGQENVHGVTYVQPMHVVRI